MLKRGRGARGGAGLCGWWCGASFAIGAWWCRALIAIRAWCCGALIVVWFGALIRCAWCWGLVVFHGWRCWGLVVLFMGGGGVPLWVFVHHVVLSLFKGEGGGWSFVFAGAPSIVIVGIILCCFCVLSSRVILITCPQHHVSLSSLCVLAMSLSHALVVVPCCCHCCALIVMCHLVARCGTCVRNIGRGR